MSEKLELYKCNVCGNIIEVIHPGHGQLVCCSLPMEQLKEKSSENEMHSMLYSTKKLIKNN